MRRQRVDLASIEPRRICVIKPSSLGDVVHALPVLSGLRQRWPDSHIGWVVNRGLRSLVEGHPALDAVIPFDRANIGPSPGGIARFGSFLRSLRAGRYDLTIDLQGLLRSGLMTAATGAPIRVGLASAREGARWFYTHAVEGSPDRPHAVDRLLAVAARFGIAPSIPDFTPILRPADREWARRSLVAVPRPRLVVNVGARWVTKRWPPESYAEVARRAVAELGAGIIAVGAAEDRPIVDRFLKGIAPHSALDLCGATSLPGLAAIAEESDLFLSNDTGPLHLAAAAGAAVLGVFTCTRPEWTGPYGPRCRVVRTGVWCAGSCVKRCERMDCMSELTPDRVWAAARAQLTGVVASRV